MFGVGLLAEGGDGRAGPQGTDFTNEVNINRGANAHNTRTLKNLTMAAVTTLIALDVFSDGRATRQLLGDIVREAMLHVGGRN